MCSTKILAAAIVSVAMVGLAQAGSGHARGHSNAPQGGVSQKQSQIVQNNQHGKQADAKSIKSDRVQMTHYDKSFKFSMDRCPSSYKKCDFGFCFYGKSCRHWEYRCWQPSCGCYFYYCPYTCCDYWLCVEDDCYYPVGFCPVAYRVKYKFGW